MSSIETSGSRGGQAFLLVSVLLAAGIGAAGYFRCRNYVQHYRDDVIGQLSAIAELKRDGLVQWRQERLADGNVFFKNFAFSALVRGFLEQPEEAEATRQLQSWLGRFQANSQYSRVSLLDARGAERLAVPATTEPAAEHLIPDVAAVLRSGQVMFNDFHRDAAGLPVHLEILVPLFGELDPRPRLGALVLRIDPEVYLYPLIKRRPTPSRTAETLLVHREGNEVVFLNELRFQTNTALNLRFPLDRAEIPAVQAALGRETTMEGLDYRGVPVVAALRTIPDSPWALVARVDAAEVYGPMREQCWQLASLIGASLLCLWACAGFAWRQKRLWFYQERAKMAEALSREAALLDHLLANIPDHIYFKDRQSRFTRINEAMAQCFGLRAASEAVGKSDRDFFTDEDAHLALVAEQQLMAAGQPILDLEEMETWPDGSKSWVSSTKVPLRDEAGQVVGLVGISRNITQRKQDEEALRESEAHYRTLVESIPQKIFIKNRNLRWVSVNENFARDFGMRPEDLVGKTDYDFFPKELADKYRADDRRILDGGQAEELEAQHIQGGSETWEQVVKTPVRDARGEITGVFGIFWDITKRRQADETIRRLHDELQRHAAELERRVVERTAQVEAANKELEAFSYSVSHDLRAPLRHVQGYVDMLAREADGHLSERGQRYMKTITDASGEMDRLIDNLLAFSRMGRAEMTETTVNLNSLAQDTLGSLEPDTRGRNIVWKIPPLPTVQGDPAMLTQVFANLLGNAVKFTRPRDPAQIELGSAGTENGHVILFVRDNGAGFDPQYAHKLFGVFQRLHRADEFEGTGIGLANVRRIIARHGGRVWAEGKLNEGATFYFTLKRSG